MVITLREDGPTRQHARIACRKSSIELAVWRRLAAQRPYAGAARISSPS